MTIREARKIKEKHIYNKNPSIEDNDLMVEALTYLIEVEHKPEDMMYLGGYYYENEQFDLALKYYLLAAEYDYDPAYECLGYIYYYGRVGKKDYQKAFEYFDKSSKKGNVVSAYKIADMYKNGYYVEKDIGKYNTIIENLYPKIKDTNHLMDPYPEIATRLASIRVSQNKEEEAISLLFRAKDFLAQRLSYQGYFGNLTIMKYLIRDLYQLIPFDEDDFDLYDLYYVLQNPVTVTFVYRKHVYVVEAVAEENRMAIRFEDKWYRNVDDFFAKASIDHKRLTSIYDELTDFEVHDGDSQK